MSGREKQKRSANYFSQKKNTKETGSASPKERNTLQHWWGIPSLTNWAFWNADLNREKGKNTLSCVRCSEQMLLGNMGGGKILMLSWKTSHPNENFHFSHSVLPKTKLQALQTHGREAPTGKPETLKASTDPCGTSLTWLVVEPADSLVTSWRWGWDFCF